MTGPDELIRPPWFEDLDAWWVSAVTEQMAARVKPLGLDSHQVLHVCCDTPAWQTHVRLMADAILGRLTLLLPDVTVTALKTTISTEVGAATTAAWVDLLGPDLAQQVEPLRRNGRELWVLARSAPARDALEQHLEGRTEALRTFLGVYGFSLWRCTLFPVTVTVVSAPDFPDLDLVQDVLLQTWHDVTQDPGPEHPLLLEYGTQTSVDRCVADWVSQHSGPDLMTNRVWGNPTATGPSDLLALPSDLYLAFLRGRGRDFPAFDQLRNRDTWMATPVLRWDR